MSSVISDKQHLTSGDHPSDYIPFQVKDPGLEPVGIRMYFGHPLYAIASAIYAARCVSRGPLSLPVIPDGCMTMVFIIGENGAGSTDSQVRGCLCGPVDEIRRLDMKPGEELMMIHFCPGAASSLRPCDAVSMTNKVFGLEMCIKDSSQIKAAAGREISLAERVRLISKMIRIRIGNDEPNYLIRYCTDRIFRMQGGVKISQLASETGYSERYLGMLFEKHVGLSPKVYSEIIRMQNSLNKLFDGEFSSPLIELALDSGYFDHAHMNRCYRRFLHCSSGALRRRGFSCLDYGQIRPYICSD